MRLGSRLTLGQPRVPSPSNVTEAYRTAGIWIEPHLEVNRSKIAGLSNWLAASCTLLAAEVILWTLSLRG